MNINRLMADIIIAAKNQVGTRLLQLHHIFLEIFQPHHFKGLAFIPARSRRMVNADYRQVSEVRTDETSFIIVCFHSHPIFHMVRFPLGKYSHSTVSLLLRRVQIRLVAQCFKHFSRILVRLQFRLLQTKNIRILLCQPFR